jgi:hypothetical protein
MGTYGLTLIIAVVSANAWCRISHNKTAKHPKNYLRAFLLTSELESVPNLI